MLFVVQHIEHFKALFLINLISSGLVNAQEKLALAWAGFRRSESATTLQVIFRAGLGICRFGMLRRSESTWSCLPSIVPPRGQFGHIRCLDYSRLPR